MKPALLDAGYGRHVVSRKVHVELRSKVSLTMSDQHTLGGGLGTGRATVAADPPVLAAVMITGL